MPLKFNSTSKVQLIRLAVLPLKDDIDIVTDESGQISISGTEGSLIDAVLKALGYRYKLVIPSDGERGSLKDGNWTGIIGELVNNRADLALGWIAPTEKRHRVVDFSNTYYSEAMTFGVTKPYPIATAYTIFNSFDLLSWIGIFTIMILITLLLLVTRARYSYLQLFLKIFGSILKQPLMINNVSGIALTLLVFWLFFTQLISCFYSSVLLSVLTKPFTPNVVRNIRELSDAVSKGNLECYTSKQSIALDFLLNSKVKYLKNLGKTIEQNHWNPSSFKDIPLKTTKNVAILHSEAFLIMANRVPNTRFLIISQNKMFSSNSAVAMRKDFCCKENFNVMLTRSVEAGLMDFYFKKFVFNKITDRRIDVEEEKILTVADFSGAFISYISGILLSIFTFIIEITIRNFSRRNRTDVDL
ncbi:Glutamate receptor ionotropic like protein [Argiope bruennichi]|uniref:Glutamate receptor ionotropic like protein n=1 Tax=Argiope bruennichi TaxID=94029 RepID=A0A8T0G1Y4_ARGBR|nr:Glutamate receptor ionotropic like protein [Argiope bruennichi]